MNQIKQLPSLNGWRAVSIMMVLIGHFTLTPAFPPQYRYLIARCADGNLAVRFFFVISGFLITYLMVREEQKNRRVNLKTFYIRRSLRILPCYFAYLIVLALFQVFGHSPLDKTDWIQLFTFTRNFNQIESIDLCPHFWSLSIEEQFYFIYPSLFIAMGALGLRARIAFLGIIIAVSTTLKCLSLFGCYPLNLYFLFQIHSTFLYLDTLAYGCIAAILFGYKKEMLTTFFSKYSLVITPLAVFCVVAPSILEFGEGLQALGFIFIAVQSILYPDFIMYKPLNNKIIMKIGVLSYSLYIWQEIVYLKWPFPALWFLALPMTFVVATISYYCLEMPFHSLRVKFAK